jgi:hypothetical protein
VGPNDNHTTRYGTHLAAVHGVFRTRQHRPTTYSHPGLYVVSVALLEPVAWVAGPDRACTVLNLRLVNLFLAVVTYA